jgi:hypothetical protein
MLWGPGCVWRNCMAQAGIEVTVWLRWVMNLTSYHPSSVIKGLKHIACLSPVASLDFIIFFAFTFWFSITIYLLHERLLGSHNYRGAKTLLFLGKVVCIEFRFYRWFPGSFSPKIFIQSNKWKCFSITILAGALSFPASWSSVDIS